MSVSIPRRYLLLSLLGVLSVLTLLLCIVGPEIFTREPKNVWTRSPGYQQFLVFGTYQGENLLYVIARASRLTLYISFISLLVSMGMGFFLIFGDFYEVTRPCVHHALRALVYFPRLFFLILLAATCGTYQTSQFTRMGMVNLGVGELLILLFGLTGAVFLASQTMGEVTQLRQQLFVKFAFALELSPFRIFLRHVLRNCTSLPITITKQFRDNILFLSTLSFIGVVQLQPEDLGGLICKYYASPEAFIEGWWILFFPCATLCWLILLFDQLAERIGAIRASRLNTF